MSNLKCVAIYSKGYPEMKYVIIENFFMSYIMNSCFHIIILIFVKIHFLSTSKPRLWLRNQPQRVAPVTKYFFVASLQVSKLESLG